MRAVFIFYCLSFFCFTKSQAQLCTGSLGDPIVNITFGSGSGTGTALGAATTSYNFFGSDCPTDGNYTVRANTNGCFSSTWHALTADHTGNANGYFMLINASNLPSDFYIDTVRNLCSNSTYEFAAWILNILKTTSCGGNGNKPNITFSIEKTDGTLIQSYNTNDILATANPTWVQHGFFFTTPAGVSNVVLRMRNNAPGGCGNDLALDDITFRRCGPLVAPVISSSNTSTANICEGIVQNIGITATVSSGFTSPEYQWQQSFNGNAFTDIVGAYGLNFTANFLPTSPIGIYKYRLAISEQGTSAVLTCRILSEPITITINPKPIIDITGEVNICAGQKILLTASGTTSYNWNGPNGFTSNIDIANVPIANIIHAGTYTVTGQNAFGCQATVSKLVVINPKPTASVSFSDTTICKNIAVNLLANGGGTYNWFPASNMSSTNIANPTVTATQTILYNVEVTSLSGCKDTTSVQVNVVKLPEVDAGPDQVLIGNSTVQLNGTISGSYDNYFWTSSIPLVNQNTLNPTAQVLAETKFYLTANGLRNCGVVLDSVLVSVFAGIFIPNVFTPNADGKNDTWNIASLRAYPNHELRVYNRYGQVVFESNANLNNWDGKYKGELQPTGSYIYILDLKNGTTIYKGTVLLVR